MTLRLLALLAALSFGVACGGPSTANPGAASTPTTAEPSASPTPPASSGPPSTDAQLIGTAPGPVGLVEDSRGRVWVANADAGTLSRLDAAGEAEDLERHVGSAPLRLAAAEGSVWVTVFRDGTLRQLDARTGKVRGTLAVGATPEGIAAAFGSLWVVLEDPAQLVQVDPATRTVIHRYPVGPGPRLVTAGHGRLWVSSYSEGRVISLDPATGTTHKSGVVCSGPQGMLVRDTTVWVACTLGNRLVGLDRSTLRPTAQLDLPGSPDAVAAGPDGTVLVALQKGPAIAVVDPAGPALVRRLRLGHVDQLYDRANIDLLVRDGVAWVSSYLEGGVYRVTL